MNNRIKLVVASISVFAGYAASAAVLTPISISKTADMEFGRIAVVRDAVIKPVVAASFIISGEPYYTYAISLPGRATLSDKEDNTIRVSSFTSMPFINGALNEAGTQTIKVSAMLNVAAKQPAGNYISGEDVEVTINYN